MEKKQPKKIEIYTIGAWCTNCGWEGILEIVKGRTAHVLGDCPKCGCDELRKV